MTPRPTSYSTRVQQCHRPRATSSDFDPAAPPLVELAGGIAGHLLAWERHERDGSWWAWVSWVHQAGSRTDHKVVVVRADSLRPLEPPEAYKAVPRRVRGLDGQIRSR